MSQNNEKESRVSEEKQKPPVESENTVGNLNIEIKRLEKLCVVFRDTIDRLEKENKELTEQVNSSAVVKSSPQQIEDNILKLQKTIANLETENKDLREKLDKLIEEAPEEPIGTVQKLVQARNAAMKPKKEIGEAETGKMAQIPEIKSGTVSELIKKRDNSIGGQEDGKFTEKLIEKTVIEHEIETVVQPEPTELQSESPPKPEDPKITVIETSEGRRICPKCHNQNIRLIREITDKTKLISTYPRIYGKKFKCGECGTEWSYNL